MSKELVLTFLAWCTFGSLIGWWITARRGLAGFIAIAIALLGTAGMAYPGLYPGLTEYWWVGLVAAIGIVLVRRNLRHRVWLAGPLVFKLLSRPNTYIDRIRTVTSDEWKDVTREVVKEKEDLARQNEDLMRTIRDLALQHKRAYKIVRDIIERRIDEDGTDNRTRIMCIAAVTESISWIDLGYGATALDPYSVTFDRPEITDWQGRFLNYQIYNDTVTQKRLLIFLPEPLRVGGGDQTVRMNQRTRRGWVDLIQRLDDFGRYEAQNQVEELRMTIHIPTSLRISQVEVNPSVGSVNIAPDGLSATWLAMALEPGGSFQYTIRCLRAT